MGDTRRVHDEAWQAAREVVAVFSGVLRDEERIDAFHEVYGLLKSRLGTFLDRRDRERARLGDIGSDQASPGNGGPS